MLISSRLLFSQARLLARPRPAAAARSSRPHRQARSISQYARNADAVASSASGHALPVATASLVLGATLLAAGYARDGASAARCSAPVGGEAVMLSPEKEPGTGILFPRLCNGMTLAGCGVRVKFGFVKIYAVGTYLDPLAMSMVKSQGEDDIKKALLDPNYPRTLRIVMNRNLSIEKYTAAIIEALEPRMKGEDLGSLEEFKKLNPKVDLVEGAEMEMTIRGDVLLYKNAVGGIGQIKSAVFTAAMCDVFYGDDAVSPTHLTSVLSGVKKL